MKINVGHNGKNIFTAQIEDFEILNGADIFIGRSENCQIVLEDNTLSRKHAKIFYENGELYIEDLSKYGGIHLNGKKVKRENLALQDKILIGDYSLSLVEWEYQSDRRDEESTPDRREEVEDKTEVLSETVILQPDAISEDIVEPDSSDEIIEEAPTENVDDFSNEDQKESFDNEFENEETQEEEFGGDDNFGDDGFSDDAFGDDGFGDDGFGDDGFSEDTGEATQVFKNFASYTLRISGEFAPFDRYQLEDSEIHIGRNPEKCQIVLNDPEVSGVHTTIKKTLINILIEDNDSSNGTIINGERINKAELKHGDVFQVGSTSFQLDVSSELINREQDILMPVDENQVVEVEELVEEEVDFSNLGEIEGESVEQEKSIIKRIMKDPVKRKKALYVLIGLVFLMIMFEDETPPEPSAEAKPKEKVEKKVKPEVVSKKHSPEVLEKLEENYVLGESKYNSGEYYEAKEYLDLVYNIDSEYKNVKTLLALVQEGFEQKLRLKAEEEAEKERKRRQLEVQKLMVKAVKAVKERNVRVAESLFGKILEIDPENIDIPQLKLELDAYKEEQARIALEKKRKEELRKSMLDALGVGKNLYLKERWFQAINELEKFNEKKGMDEDLIKDATKMINESKVRLAAMIEPLLGKARAYKEGQDYKRAYETYGEILKHNPANEEALNERDSILERLNTNSMKLYREALISESLSLFDEAKEKFQQVQQISPINSDYYNKATEKLKQYTD